MHSDNHQKCNDAAGCEPPCSYGYEWQELQDISLNLQEEKMDDEVCIYNNVGK